MDLHPQGKVRFLGSFWVSGLRWLDPASPEHAKLHGSSETFPGHTTDRGAPSALLVLRTGFRWALAEACVHQSPVSGELSFLSRMQRLSRRRTSPGATFIHETVVLTMATSVRGREEPQPQALSPLLGAGDRAGRRWWEGTLATIIRKETHQTQQPAL